MRLKDLFKDSLKNLGLYMPAPPLWVRPLSAKSSFCRAVVANGMLTKRQMVHAALRYRLDRSKDDAVIYWQIDQMGRVHDGKLMWYGADCHRLKNRHATWAMYLLKKHFGMAPESFVPKHVLFGLHLLSHPTPGPSPHKGGEYPKVCIVEAEKSAVILSELYPQYVWLAAGGLFELQPPKFWALQHCQIILLPDTDEELRAYTEWYDVAQQVMQSFLWPKQNRIYVSDFLERHASADQKRRKIDLVDYIQEST